MAGGKGVLIQHDLSATLGCHNDQTLFAPKAFGVGSDKSKGMLSANPKSGFYEAATSRTLDRSGGNACCNQGGMVVVSPAYSIRPMVNTQTQQEQTPSLMARDSKDPLLVSLPSYCLDRACFTSGENAQYRLSVRAEVAATLVAEGAGRDLRAAGRIPRAPADAAGVLPAARIPRRLDGASGDRGTR